MPNESTVSASSQRRSKRRDEILAATRTLFDESGSRDAQIDEIAKAVGVNRAIIYRHFSSKEEIFAEVVVSYLGELQTVLAAAAADSSDPEIQLAGLSDGIIEFGLRQPAFVDCALTLVRRPLDELIAEVGGPVMTRLTEAMWSCLSHVVTALTLGNETGAFNVDDPVLLANLYYGEALGILSFASLQVSVGQTPQFAGVPSEQVKQLARLAALGQARG